MNRTIAAVIALLASSQIFAEDNRLSLTTGLDYSTGDYGTADDTEVFFIPNIAPDEGLSAGFNALMEEQKARARSVEAIQDKDFPVLQGTFLVFSAGVILANLLADCLYFYLDPRVQTR